ncbi:hypothetical protein CYY_007045 [Polysphondylium violaceum]|uniref:Thioesterase domain-containing protein n=1 Tax=Polysphondylium violaceum TaxID=133409 RepID=A0A8J4PP70_9MYCE|nr:hypothetical protein CYY_007045 [Polysphondylium violaceum]
MIRNLTNNILRSVCKNSNTTTKLYQNSGSRALFSTTPFSSTSKRLYTTNSNNSLGDILESPLVYDMKSFMKYRSEKGLVLTNDQWLEILKKRAGAGLPNYVNFEVLNVTDKGVLAQMKVHKHHMAVNGYIHAASIIALADTSTGFGAFTKLPLGALGFTTIELKSNFIGTAVEGALLECNAELVHAGKSTQVWDATIKDLDLFKLCFTKYKQYYSPQYPPLLRYALEYNNPIVSQYLIQLGYFINNPLLKTGVNNIESEYIEYCCEYNLFDLLKIFGELNLKNDKQLYYLNQAAIRKSFVNGNIEVIDYLFNNFLFKDRFYPNASGVVLEYLSDFDILSFSYVNNHTLFLYIYELVFSFKRINHQNILQIVDQLIPAKDRQDKLKTFQYLYNNHSFSKIEILKFFDQSFKCGSLEIYQFLQTNQKELYIEFNKRSFDICTIKGSFQSKDKLKELIKNGHSLSLKCLFKSMKQKYPFEIFAFIFKKIENSSIITSLSKLITKSFYNERNDILLFLYGQGFQIKDNDLNQGVPFYLLGSSDQKLPILKTMIEVFKCNILFFETTLKSAANSGSIKLLTYLYPIISKNVLNHGGKFKFRDVNISPNFHREVVTFLIDNQYPFDKEDLERSVNYIESFQLLFQHLISTENLNPTKLLMNPKIFDLSHPKFIKWLKKQEFLDLSQLSQIINFSLVLEKSITNLSSVKYLLSNFKFSQLSSQVGRCQNIHTIKYLIENQDKFLKPISWDSIFHHSLYDGCLDILDFIYKNAKCSINPEDIKWAIQRKANQTVDFIISHSSEIVKKINISNEYVDPNFFNLFLKEKHGFSTHILLNKK